MTDVIVIGAGPAGSVAALLLARRRSVTLIEQHRFPRDKVCGECLSALGAEVIERIGLGPAFRETGVVVLRRGMLHSRDGQTASFDLPRPMFGLSRQALDMFLLDHAARAGASVLVPTRCESLDVQESQVSVRVRDLASNQVQTLQSSCAIVADGKSALPGPAPAPTRDFGIKCHWANVDGPRDTIELFGLNGCYGGLSAIEDGLWNTAFSVPAARLAGHRGDISSLFAQMLTENPALQRRLRTAKQTRPWLASPLPRFAVRRNWPARIIPVGNAAAAIEPIGGEGMGLAMRSAELAAGTLLESNGGNEKWETQLRPAYEHLWRVPRALCRAGAMLTSSSGLSPIAFPLLTLNERAVRTVLQAIGK